MIPHIQGQRNPSKTIGAGAAAAWCWGDCEVILHVQGQRRSPNKMVRGAKLSLESNPIPTRDAQRVQTNLVRTRTQRLKQNCVWKKNKKKPCVWVSLEEVRVSSGLLWGQVSGGSRHGYGISPLGGGHH